MVSSCFLARTPDKRTGTGDQILLSERIYLGQKRTKKATREENTPVCPCRVGTQPTHALPIAAYIHSDALVSICSGDGRVAHRLCQ